MLLDCGAVQADALTVDRLASLEKVRKHCTLFHGYHVFFQFGHFFSSYEFIVFYFFITNLLFSTLLCQYSETAVKPRASILEKETEWLNSIKADLVVLYHFWFNYK